MISAPHDHRPVGRTGAVLHQAWPMKHSMAPVPGNTAVGGVGPPSTRYCGFGRASRSGAVRSFSRMKSGRVAPEPRSRGVRFLGWKLRGPGPDQFVLSGMGRLPYCATCRSSGRGSW